MMGGPITTPSNKKGVIGPPIEFVFLNIYRNID